METDSDEKQLLNQILNAVKVTPSLNEDLQVEVMKVCVTWLQFASLGQEQTLTPALTIISKMPLHCDHASSPVIWNTWLLSWLLVPQNYLDC